MKPFSNLWETLSQVGAPHAKGSLERRYTTRLINQISVILIAVSSFRIIIEVFILKDFTGALFAGSVALGVSLVLLLNHFGYSNVSRWYITVIFTMLLTLMKITFGAIIGADFGYLLITLIAVIIYQKPSEKIMGGLIIGSGFIFSVIFLNQQPAFLADEGNASTAYFFLIGTAICLVSILNRFIKNNRSYEQDLRIANRALRKGQVEIEQKNHELELLNGDMEKFVYSASHDLKTPLRNVISFLGLASRKVSNNENSEALELIELARKNGSSLHSLLDDILNYSRINYDSTKQEVVDLNELMQEIESSLATVKKQTDFSIYYDELPTIRANKNQMKALFQNIIENGLKYNQSHHRKVTISVVESAHFTEIQFSDNGIGINKSYEDQIFQMFKRLHSAGEFEGNGIGLATCKRIADSMNCSLYLDTSYQNGSRFVFRIPRKLMAAA